MDEAESEEYDDDRAESLQELVKALDECGITTAEYRELSSSLKLFLDLRYRESKEQAAFTVRDWMSILYKVMNRKMIEDDEENEDPALRSHLIDEEWGRTLALQVLTEGIYKLQVDHRELFDFGETLALARPPVTLFLFENGANTGRRFEWPAINRNK